MSAQRTTRNTTVEMLLTNVQKNFLAHNIFGICVFVVVKHQQTFNDCPRLKLTLTSPCFT